MATIQWRPAVNALTVPQSYKMLHVPRNIVGYAEIAAEVAAENPNWNAELVEAIMRAERKVIQRRLINGDQVTLEDSFSYRISLLGKLASPDDPLPSREDLIQVNVYVSSSYLRAIRYGAILERIAATQKQPLITAAEDTRFKLNDVLNPNGVLRLTGTNLTFKEGVDGCGCVIEGTRNGRTSQSQFASIENAAVMVVPDIPAQDAPWNNEYIVSITTKYTANGLLRTGTYERKLRSPLLVDGFHEGGVGVLTDSADVPYVRVINGVVSANETLRIQAILDIHAGHLRFNLLDMEEGGKAGAVLIVTTNGEYTLQGFAGSAVTSLLISVDNFADLVDMARNFYMTRVVDILDVRVGT